MLRIFMVRHGETNWNVAGRYQGLTDTELSEKGWGQGKKVAEALANQKIDKFYASPLQRALETCKLIAAHHNKEVEIDDNLIEINHGEWEGLLVDEIEAKFPGQLKIWFENPAEVMMPNGENLEAVRQRMHTAFTNYAKKHANETILITAHDASLKAVLCDIMGISLNNFWKFKQDNTCIDILEFDGVKWRIVLLNNINHLGHLVNEVEQKGL